MHMTKGEATKIQCIGANHKKQADNLLLGLALRLNDLFDNLGLFNQERPYNAVNSKMHEHMESGHGISKETHRDLTQSPHRLPP